MWQKALVQATPLKDTERILFMSEFSDGLRLPRAAFQVIKHWRDVHKAPRWRKRNWIILIHSDTETYGNKHFFPNLGKQALSNLFLE